MIQVTLLRPAQAGACAMACVVTAACASALLVACSRDEPAPPASTARPTAAEIEQLRSTAERSLDDGRLDDALRVARYLAERVDDATSHELLGRIHVADAARAQAHGCDAGSARQAAAAAYRRAAEHEPGNAALQHAAAMVIDSFGEPVAARPLFDRAVALSPRNAEFLLHRAYSSLRGNDVDAARADLDAMRAVAPTDPWRHALEAELGLAGGDTTAAVVAARAAVDASPDDIGLRLLLSRSLRADGRYADAVLGLRSIDDASRTRPVVAAELAAGFTALGRPRDAAMAWEAAMQATADDAPTAAATARAWLAAGDALRARAAIDELRRRAPSHEAIAVLEAELRGGAPRADEPVNEASGPRPAESSRP